MASPSGSTADVADLELQGRGAGISTTFSSSLRAEFRGDVRFS
jgi:hypothetical protein